MSNPGDQRLKRLLILAIILAVPLVLAVGYCHKSALSPVSAPQAEPEVPEDVEQPEPKTHRDPPVDPLQVPLRTPLPETPAPAVTVKAPKPPPDHVIRFSDKPGYRIVSMKAESDDLFRRPIAPVVTNGMYSFSGLNQLNCRIIVLTPSDKYLYYYFHLEKPSQHKVWDVVIDSAWRPRLSVDKRASDKALPGLRVDRQFCWTRRGIP